MAAEVETRPAQIKLAIPTHAPTSTGPSAFYSLLQQELARILVACDDEASDTSGQCGDDDTAVLGDQVAVPTTDAHAAGVLDGARQLEVDVERLWRLDQSILRTADMVDMLDAPPVLAPGPHVTGSGSAAVRLKQLRAAFVARSQQVNMAHNRYRCLSKHNDLYKTYVRTSSDSIVPGSPTSTMAPPGGYSSHTSSASDETAISGLAVSRASSYGCGSELAESWGLKTSSHHSGGGGGLCSGSEGGVTEPRAVPEIEPMDVDHPQRPPSPTSTLSASSSRADPADAPSTSPSSRGRKGGGGFLGLGAFFGRGRWQAKSPELPAPLQQSQPEHQVPPTIMEDSIAAVPELELRRSFSDPTAIRRGALELSRDADLPFRRRGFAMECNNDEAGPSFARRSREKKRSSGESLRAKSEPAPMSRDARRRRNFIMEDAEDDSCQDHFINPDLETRAQIFNSEHQLYREDGDYKDFTCRPRR